MEVKSMSHGYPIFRKGAEVLWKFPNNELGVISLEDAIYLCRLSRGEVEANRKYINVIR